ncbi:hypothetical protein KBZ20_15065 [Vulcanococcus limneticus Candia 3F8]|uniref:condensation domain-containing protein n=1 Tax=Vulcanococcus limneticus TaxID=2170428 RepID=UPI000B99CA2B|nr:condensation domain-containing protein [Vulcanococcus limneticus]MCP9793251.1 hypothetical protein [Vulcanococcus limneticus MW73D5]MCP9895093.1 hypothetical protein [Vulcanococcus limneticus Candia 3F8]MCP9898647.1 hypothetical protein [Vulcanococcus limneticus Candia 3B3]
MNVIERAECLLDSGSSGNMNFTVIAAYRGPLDIQTLEQGLKALQGQHRLLGSTLVWEGRSCHFSPTGQPVPVHVLPLPDNEAQAWKPATMAALRQRFDAAGQPLWRVSWLRGASQGQLLLTFHHAIADGLSAMALVQQLFQLLGALPGTTAAPAWAGNGEEKALNLEDTFATARYGAFPVQTLPERQDAGLSTGYVLEELSAEASRALLGWSRERGLRLNATLHAAFLQALVNDGLLPPRTTAHTVVNLRGLAQPTLPWDLMRLLRVCVDTPIVVDPTAPLDGLALQLHGVLQQQLRNGAPIMALNTIAAAVADAPSPRQLWQRSWREGGLITNLGKVPVQAQHGIVELERLFFVANIEPIAMPDRPLAVLGALSFRERLMLTCFHIEQQLDEHQAMAVMADMKRRLLAAPASGRSHIAS